MKNPRTTLCQARATTRSVAQIMLLTMALACASVGPAVAATTHEGHEKAQSAGRVLGKIDFPTSATDANAQAAFIRGMLLLHLFEYDFARAEFLEAQVIEPDFAMAYWGEAMTYNHPIWDEQDLAAAQLALAKLGATAQERKAAAGTPVEKDFLRALDALYGTGTKVERDHAYLRVMEQMAADYPADDEVQLFYALALMGQHEGVRDIPSYMQATAIAQSVFSANPQHPGAAHYLIHGVDDPDHAALGLEAARALGEIAPDAGHSLHMTSHIFTALGMWEDVVKANRRAIKVANDMRATLGEPPRTWGHYTSWLLYAYLQQGRIERAEDILNAAFLEIRDSRKAPEDPMILDPDRSQLGSVVQMWARYLIETQDWDGDIAQWKFNMGTAFDPNLTFSFIQAMRAVYNGSPSVVAQYLEQFRATRTELTRLIRSQPEIPESDLIYLDRLAVMEQEMLAGIEMARGEYLAASTVAREASRLESLMPIEFGPPFVDWPANEVLGESLLAARKPADAEGAFKEQLKRTPLRARALLGLAQTQHILEHDTDARYTLEKLGDIWERADPRVKAKWDEMEQSLAPEAEAAAEEAVEADSEESDADIEEEAEAEEEAEEAPEP